MKGSFKGLLCGALIGCIPAIAVGQDVTIADPNYPVGRATAYIIKAVAEQELGLEVNTVASGAVPVIWQAMDRGKGEIDVWSEVWLPNQQALVDEYVQGKGTVKLSTHPMKGNMGYCATAVTVKKHGVKSVYDLANPDNAQLFDSDGDGKGEIWIGAAGWPSTNNEKVRARDYGFAEFFELQSTDEAVAMAQLDRAAKANKPWVGYCYGPHQNFSLYELEYLDEPPHDPSKWNVVQPDEDPNWYEKASITTAYPDLDVYVAYSARLEESAPLFVEFLNNLRFDAKTVSQWAYELAVEGKEPDTMAREWVQENPDIVNKWLGR